jgi:neutral amino acid transport system permease protein
VFIDTKLAEQVQETRVLRADASVIRSPVARLGSPVAVVLLLLLAAALALSMTHGVQSVAQQTLFGLVSASYLALGAVGLTLIYGILRLANFAHGDMLTVGAYAAYAVSVSLGAPLAVGIVAAIAASACLGLASEALFFRRARVRNAGVLELFLITLGLAFVFRFGLQFVAGGRSVGLGVDNLTSIHFLGLRLATAQLVVLVVGILVLLAVGWTLKASRFGRQLRAMADDPDLAALSGVNTERRVRQLWLLAGGMTGLAGVMLAAAVGSMTPSLGFSVLLPMFAIAVMGGIGNAYGALAAALVLGIFTEWAVLVIDFRWKPLVAFSILLLVLLFRPQGIFGDRVAS